MRYSSCLGVFSGGRENGTVGISPISTGGISETGEREHWECCWVLPQKPGEVDGQCGTAGGRRAGRGVLEQMLKLEATGHQSGRGSRAINIGTQRLRSWVRPLGSHHTSAWEVWQRDHQGLPNVPKEDVGMSCLPRLEFISIST